MNIELIQIPKYSSENFILTYSAVNPKMRNIYHADGTPARVSNCTSEQLKEIHKLMTDARKHRKGKLAPIAAHDVEENLPTQPTVITDSSQLVVGQQYRTEDDNILELVNIENEVPNFKFISGKDDYYYFKGLIPFGKIGFTFYPINQ